MSTSQFYVSMRDVQESLQEYVRRRVGDVEIINVRPDPDRPQNEDWLVLTLRRNDDNRGDR